MTKGGTGCGKAGWVSTSRRPYRTDLSDARWALIEPLLTEWRSQRKGLGIAKIQHDLREIVNAILYVNRTGIAWEYLPHDFPPRTRRCTATTPDGRPTG
jgi:transposase